MLHSWKVWDWSHIALAWVKRCHQRWKWHRAISCLKYLNCLVCVYFILYTSYNFTAYVPMMNKLAQIHFRRLSWVWLTCASQPDRATRGHRLSVLQDFQHWQQVCVLIFKLKPHKHYSLRITKNLFNCHRCSFKCDLNAITFFKRSLARKSWNGWNTIIIVIITTIIIVIVTVILIFIVIVKITKINPKKSLWIEKHVLASPWQPLIAGMVNVPNALSSSSL